MATIKFKRGSGVPTGLTAYEAAWDTSLGRFFIHNGSTATWIGARIDDSTSLGGAGVCAYYVPTQLAVKTYVDNQVAGGAVSSVNGLTGAVTGVAFLGTAQTFTQLQSFSAGISLSNAGANLITTAGDLLRLGYGAGSNVYIGNQASPNNFIEVTEDAITIQSANPIYGNLVTSVNGLTGTITGVARLGTAQTFTQLQSFSAGISASGGATLAGTVNLTGSLLATSNVRGSTHIAFNPWPGFGAYDGFGNYGSSRITFTFDSTGINERQSLIPADLPSIGEGAHSVIQLPNDSGTVALTKTTVSSIAGTSNQITASGSTGAVTLSLPSAVTMPGSLTVTGDLVVNGTTTTVNSNTVTIQDPVIAIGGAGTTNAPPPSGDVKDRGIIFQYNSSGGKTGFFGHDQSTGYFTYIPNIASLSSDVVTGTAGTAQFNEVRGLSGVTFTITAPATTSSIIEMRGGAVYNNTIISLESSIVEIGNYGSRSGIKFTEGGRGHILYPAASMSANRTYDLPDHSGAIVVPSDLGVGGYILSSQGPTSQPVWIKPDEAGTGITASAAKLVTVSSSTDTTSFLTFIDTASNSNQAIRYNSSLAYNATTNYLDVNIDCGTY